jgi:hypothetical protein
MVCGDSGVVCHVFIVGMVDPSPLQLYFPSLGVLLFIATFNNISVILWQSVLLVEETDVPRKKHTDLLTRKSLTNFIT